MRTVIHELPAASAGAMPTSRACCAELDEKQPNAHGATTSAMDTRPVPSGHTSMLSAMQAMAKTTISVAEVVPSPMTSIRKGRATRPVAAMRRGA